MALTSEEQKEIDDLENEVSDVAIAAVEAKRRQHLDALRMAKRIRATGKVQGVDFAVLETVAGNFAVKRPEDVLVDTFQNDTDSKREDVEKFAMAVTLEPDATAIQGAFAKYAGLCSFLAMQATKLLRVYEEEEAKK